MEVKQAGVVAAIKKILFVFLLTSLASAHAQIDSLGQFKKKVLETVEVDLLMSYYEQAGTHAAVTGGLGNEYLTDYNPTIVVRIPVNEDAVLTADVGMSAYTSASSSNGNPFNRTGASGNYNENEPYPRGNSSGTPPQGSPWITSSGASGKDVLTTLNVAFQKASDDRNFYWAANIGGSTEYDYESFNAGLSFARLWNEKNTELSFKSQLFFDRWKPIILLNCTSMNFFNLLFYTTPTVISGG